MFALLRTLKTSLLNGLLIIVPVVLLVLLLGEVLDELFSLVEPAADLLPPDLLPPVLERWMVGGLLIAGLCLVVGGLARTRIVGRGFGAIEQATLGKIGLYQFLKRLTGGLLGLSDESARSVPCGLLTHSDGRQQLVYLIERGSQHTTILIPTAPTGLSGQVFLVNNAQLTTLNVTMADAMLMYNKIGDGFQALVSQSSMQQPEGADTPQPHSKP